MKRPGQGLVLELEPDGLAAKLLEFLIWKKQNQYLVQQVAETVHPDPVLS
jgi:hypothetical protein